MDTPMNSFGDDFERCRILVIGDVMLDRYLWGDVRRISPEAPVPVYHVKKRSAVPGGAGSVVMNLIGLGVSATLIGVIGQDDFGKTLRRLFDDQKINTKLLEDSSRPTITKSRILSKGQQLLRIDDESSVTIDDRIKSKIIAEASKQIPHSDVVIISDYGKGLFQASGLTEKIIEISHKHDTPVVVDPKGKNWERYAGATCITPNTAEIMLVTGEDFHDDNDLAKAMSKVQTAYHLQHLLVTRGANGMCLLSKGRQSQFIPAIAREVYDVSGAGDTVIATLATGIAAGMSFSDAARMANIAAGVVVGKLGTQPINLLELRAAEGLNTDEVCGTVNTKVHSLAAAVVQAQAWKAVNDKVVFTNGCFDLLHPGHIHLLNEAKRCGHRLIVGLNSDDSVRRIKGPQRPILSDSDRAAILGALDCVDLVVIFDEDTPIKLIDALKPDILVKGADYSIENVVGREIVESNGGRVQLVPVREGYSTTGITEKMSQMGNGKGE